MSLIVSFYRRNVQVKCHYYVQLNINYQSFFTLFAVASQVFLCECVNVLQKGNVKSLDTSGKQCFKCDRSLCIGSLVYQLSNIAISLWVEQFKISVKDTGSNNVSSAMFRAILRFLSRKGTILSFKCSLHVRLFGGNAVNILAKVDFQVRSHQIFALLSL